MKITKHAVHPDLRSGYYFGKLKSWIYARKGGINLVNLMMNTLKGKNVDSLECEERFIPSRNGGPDIRVRIFRPKTDNIPLPAILYNHGGGYVACVPEVALNIIADYIKLRPSVVVAPDYRKAITHPFPAAFDDCYDTLLWMRDNSVSLRINSDKFIIAGASAGGGLTAAISLKARDTQDVKIAFQVPLYPMLDHRQETESIKENNGPYWDSKANALGWRLYLRNIGETVPGYASPALNEVYDDFPPTITFIGELDPFRDEVIEYVDKLKAKNIPVKFEVFAGAFHGFENIKPRTELAKRAKKFHHEAFVDYFDRYL